MTLSDTVTATDLLTGILAVVTAFYAWVTYCILKANERTVALMGQQLELLNRPYIQIVALLRPGTNLIRLCITNSGKTPAFNLRLKIDRDFFQFAEKRDDRNLANQSAFTSPIDCFSPTASLEFLLATGPDMFSSSADDAVTPKVFAIEANYNFDKKIVTETTVIDLRPYFGTAVPHSIVKEGFETVAKAVNDIARELKNQ